MIQTREIRNEELGDLLALYAHMHTSDSPLPADEIVQSVWNQIQQAPYFNYFGTYSDGNLVSSCALSVIPNLTRGCRPYGLIENVVTHAAHRQRGYANRAIRHALDYAWNANCYKVMLLTGRKSEAVYRFYESVGFDRHEKQAFIAKPPTT